LRRNQCVKALQAKAGAGNVDIVHLLIDAGADVNARGVGRGSAFAAARNRGNETIELILLGARTRLRTTSKNVVGINTARGYSVPKDV
jgi:ankyrin repeat protein